jgi:hypothetical protein
MLKLLLLVLGLAGGAGGATAWLLSEPDPTSAPVTPYGSQDRLTVLKGRLQVALAEGARAQQETETRLQTEFATLRKHPKQADISS